MQRYDLNQAQALLVNNLADATTVYDSNENYNEIITVDPFVCLWSFLTNQRQHKH